MIKVKNTDKRRIKRKKYIDKLVAMYTKNLVSNLYSARGQCKYQTQLFFLIKRIKSYRRKLNESR